MKTVLVVDDSTYQRKVISDILTDAGFEVVAEAKNGDEAVDKAIELAPKYITIDHIMPEMTGIEAVEEMRENGVKSKILMISSVAQDAVQKEALSVGVNKFLKKPYQNEDIVNSLNEL